MKREKSSDIIAEICTEANIRQSITAVLRGSHRKKTKEGRRIIENIDKITAFYEAVATHISSTQAAGWEYKAAIDWENYVTA